jgi:hypothetical protein
MIAPSQLTRHHVLPRSRCKELGVKANNPNNIVLISRKQHEAYHTLFDRKTPSEIIDFLLTHFWNNRIEVEDFMETP